MPIYEYRCAKCGRTFEKIQKFSDEPVKVHDECGGEVEKLISTSALQFKGTGFYITDYAKGGSPKPGGDSKGESKSEGKGESKSDSKSDSKGSDSKSESKSESKSDSKSDSKGDSSSSKSSESRPAPAAKAD
jgi:putative FmdB family regulatory protein